MLSLHRPTSTSSPTAQFQWLSPTDKHWSNSFNWTLYYFFSCRLRALDSRLLSYDCLRLISQTQSQSQSYFTTGGLPPISSSWRQSLETHDHRFFSSWTPAVLHKSLSWLWRAFLYNIYRVALSTVSWNFILNCSPHPTNRLPVCMPSCISPPFCRIQQYWSLEINHLRHKLPHKQLEK
jgi:hypothetical protein